MSMHTHQERMWRGNAQDLPVMCITESQLMMIYLKIGHFRYYFDSIVDFMKDHVYFAHFIASCADVVFLITALGVQTL